MSQPTYSDRKRAAVRAMVAALPDGPLFVAAGLLPGADDWLPVAKSELAEVVPDEFPALACAEGRLTLDFRSAPDHGKPFWRFLKERLAAKRNAVAAALHRPQVPATPEAVRYRAGALLFVLEDAEEARAALRAGIARSPSRDALLVTAEAWATLFAESVLAMDLVERVRPAVESFADQSAFIRTLARVGPRGEPRELLDLLDRAPGWIMETDTSHDALGELLSPMEAARRLTGIEPQAGTPRALRLARCWSLAADEPARARALLERACPAATHWLDATRLGLDAMYLLADPALARAAAAVGERDAHSPTAHRELGATLVAAGARPRAVELIDEALQQAPDAPTEVELAMARFDVAGPAPQVHEAVARAEGRAGSSAAWRAIAEAWDRLGDPARAQKAREESEDRVGEEIG